MNKIKLSVLWLLVLMCFVGCGEVAPAVQTVEEENLESVRVWFEENTQSGDPVHSVHLVDTSYLLLTISMPPGVEDIHTAIKAYIIEEDGDSYCIKASKSEHAASNAGFTAELLTWEDTTVLFGDIGDVLYDIVEMDGMKDVTFVEVVVELTNGEIISKPVENNSLYFVSIPTEAQVSDITFKTVEDIRYSDYFSESLDGAPSFVEGDEVDG